MPNYGRFIRYQWQRRFLGKLPREIYYPMDSLRGRPITLLDVGGFRGDFTASVAGSFRLGKVVIVEPQPELAMNLRARFDASWCTIAQCAVSDTVSQMELEVSSHATSTASLLRIHNDLPELRKRDLSERRRFLVDVLTIDDVAREHLEGGIDLFKIDIQGNELRAFQGASAVLGRTNYIYAELSLRKLYEGACLMQEVIDYLRTLDFDLVDLSPEFRSPDGELLQVNGVFRNRSQRGSAV